MAGIGRSCGHSGNGSGAVEVCRGSVPDHGLPSPSHMRFNASLTEETCSMNKVTPFLMFNDQLEEAIAFYAATFPDSEIRTKGRSGEDGPVISAEFVVGGQFFLGFNGGSYFSFSQGFSLFVDCEDQREVDEYWDRFIRAGATPLQCGWITDPFGVTWQIVPRRFTEMVADSNPKKVKAVMDAMMPMVKLDVAELERAYDAA